jgi:nucleoside diphosphate kinase
MSAADVRAAVDQRFPGSGAAPASNEFVIFSKPEVGRLSGADLDKVWDLLASSFSASGVTVHATKILTGSELESSGAMADHYGVINKISRLGRSALTEATEQALAEQYATELDAGAEVLGGHQFLDTFGEFSPVSLGVLFANLSVGRLGPGTYAAVANVDGQTVVILNGFHPRQLSFFTAEDTVCAFLHGSSATSWESLRGDLIGTTDPSKADAGSIRGTLFADPASFGLATVSYNFNGVHMSAGPLEGLVELVRFFGGSVGDYSFAAALRTAGVSDDGITRLAENPTLEVRGERGSAFDLTEGVDADQAATLLAGATPAD